MSKGHTSVQELMTKFDTIAQQIGVPIDILVSLEDDINRKPRQGGWRFLLKHKFGIESVHDAMSKTNLVRCTYVGDAAGRPKSGARKKDFSASDYLFSLNAGINVSELTMSHTHQM